jgi:phosphate transport system protein
MNRLAPRETFDLKLDQLQNQLLVLGSMVEQATLDSVDALKRRDIKAAQHTYSNDKKINQKRFEIENSCISLIALQQPIASDLRILASILDIASELERMGDYAKGIARICLLMKDQPPVKIPVEITRMAEITSDMLHRSLGAFVSVDLDQALEIPKEDDLVDDLYNQINHDIVSAMIHESISLDWMNYLSWATHNLERMADRVTNICERTIYVATGEMKELHSSDDEQRSNE